MRLVIYTIAGIIFGIINLFINLDGVAFILFFLSTFFLLFSVDVIPNAVKNEEDTPIEIKYYRAKHFNFYTFFSIGIFVVDAILVGLFQPLFTLRSAFFISFVWIFNIISFWITDLYYQRQLVLNFFVETLYSTYSNKYKKAEILEIIKTKKQGEIYSEYLKLKDLLKDKLVNDEIKIFNEENESDKVLSK